MVCIIYILVGYIVYDVYTLLSLTVQISVAFLFKPTTSAQQFSKATLSYLLSKEAAAMERELYCSKIPPAPLSYPISPLRHISAIGIPLLLLNCQLAYNHQHCALHLKSPWSFQSMIPQKKPHKEKID
jgi:hypothetical protein